MTKGNAAIVQISRTITCKTLNETGSLKYQFPELYESTGNFVVKFKSRYTNKKHKFSFCFVCFKHCVNLKVDITH